MRGSAIHGPINPAESFAGHAVRRLATGCAATLLQAWRACEGARWQLARQRSRRALVQLDDRMLSDIGITREQALREAEKPFWWD